LLAIRLLDGYALPQKEVPMSASDYAAFRAQMMRYKMHFDQDRDSSRYFSNAAVTALGLFLAERNEMLRKMGKAGVVLPAALSVSSPVFMAAIDCVAEQMQCPVEERMSAVDFLRHFGSQIESRYDSEYAEPVRKALKTVHDGLHSLGLTG
jgi:hypothetical protein